MPEAALLVLSRALGAPRVVCANAASAAGIPGLRVRQVAALLLVHERGPQRSLELGVMLGAMAGQPVVDAFRQLNLMTPTGRGRDSRLSLSDSGQELASLFIAELDALWMRATRDLFESQCDGALAALRSVGGRPFETMRPSRGFPVELIVVLDRLVGHLVEDTLLFVDQPGLRDSALRPLLLLADGPATPAALAAELGIGAPAVNAALAPAHRTDLVEWRQRDLWLTGIGERVVRRVRLASDAFWLGVEHAGSAQASRSGESLLTNIGRGFPASARS